MINYHYQNELIDTLARQAGTYRYETKNEFVKTVPIVRILDK